MSRLSTFLLLSALVCLSWASGAYASVDVDDDEMVVAEQVDLAPFSAYEYLAGEWEVYRHVLSFTSGTTDYSHSMPVARWRLEKENTTTNLLFGRAWVNGTSDAEGAALRVEFPEEHSAGKFQSGDDEDNLHTLFHFAFQQVPTSIPISVGVWNGAEMAGDAAAAYVFQASTADRFTITVTPRNFNLAEAGKAPSTPKKAASADDDDDVSTGGPASTGHPLLSYASLTGGESFIYVGHRIKVEVEKTFFQKYGTMAMLGGMMILNLYMKTRQSTAQLTGQAARTSSPAPARGAKRTGARVEEITEGEISVDGKKDK